jgi:hypothetical protein
MRWERPQYSMMVMSALLYWKKGRPPFLNFESGEIVRKESPNRIIASADFFGDGHREVLVGLAETDFAILDGKLNELNKISLSDDYWYEPIVTSAVHPLSYSLQEMYWMCMIQNWISLKKFVAEGALSPCYCCSISWWRPQCSVCSYIRRARRMAHEYFICVFIYR